MLCQVSIGWKHYISDHLTDEGFADKNRKVSFNMFGGAQKEKSRFHQGVATAGHRR